MLAKDKPKKPEKQTDDKKAYCGKLTAPLNSSPKDPSPGQERLNSLMNT